MTRNEHGRRVETILMLRFSCGRSPASLGEALSTIRRAGGDLRLHVTHVDDRHHVVRCVCTRAAEAALALEERGLEVGLETAVWVEAEDRPGALGHLVQSVEAAGVGVVDCFGLSNGESLCTILQTDDNPRAEDALRAYLDPGT
jgi:hypothetical protein